MPGTEFTMDADLVLLAMGFTGPVKQGMIEQFGVEARCARQHGHAEQIIKRPVPGVFAAGERAAGNRWSCGPSPKARKAAEIWRSVSSAAERLVAPQAANDSARSSPARMQSAMLNWSR